MMGARCADDAQFICTPRNTRNIVDESTPSPPSARKSRFLLQAHERKVEVAASPKNPTPAADQRRQMVRPAGHGSTESYVADGGRRPLAAQGEQSSPVPLGSSCLVVPPTGRFSRVSSPHTGGQQSPALLPERFVVPAAGQRHSGRSTPRVSDGTLREPLRRPLASSYTKQADGGRRPLAAQGEQSSPVALGSACLVVPPAGRFSRVLSPHAGGQQSPAVSYERPVLPSPERRHSARSGSRASDEWQLERQPIASSATKQDELPVPMWDERPSRNLMRKPSAECASRAAPSQEGACSPASLQDNDCRRPLSQRPPTALDTTTGPAGSTYCVPPVSQPQVSPIRVHPQNRRPPQPEGDLLPPTSEKGGSNLMLGTPVELEREAPYETAAFAWRPCSRGSNEPPSDQCAHPGCPPLQVERPPDLLPRGADHCAPDQKMPNVRPPRHLNRVTVTVMGASLVRVFDSFSKQQDLYLKLVRKYHNDDERIVATTQVAKNGNLFPMWKETFTFRKENGRDMLFRVYVKHSWVNDFMCGEAGLDLESLLASDEQELASPMHLPLKQKEETVGVLKVLLEPQTDVANREQSTLVPIDGISPRTRSLSSVAELQMVLRRPEDLTDDVRSCFWDVTQSSGATDSDGTPVLRPQDLKDFANMVMHKTNVHEAAFASIDQAFWRFEYSGQGVLHEEEVVKLIVLMLRHYRDRLQPRNGAAVRLGDGIVFMDRDQKYDVGERLGSGGQGTVYLATTRASGKAVVLKEYNKTNENASLDDITEEFELLMTLKHPKISRVFDIFQDSERICVVQEPYFGGDLTQLMLNAMTAGVTTSERWLSPIIHQVLSGVYFLHTQGVMHCDLKEANVMVTGHEDWSLPQVVVIDFGLSNKFTSQTKAGGTPGYIPPEVWERGLWTPRGDVFSLGIMIYSLCYGFVPTTKGCRKLKEVARKTVTERVTMGTKASEELQEFVNLALHPRMLKRPVVAQVMNLPWFTSVKAGMSLNNTSELEQLVQRQKKTVLYKALLADVASQENLAPLRELNALFLKLDHNNDGFIAADELRAALGDWGKEDVDALISSLDLSGGGGEGLVNYEEFMGQLMAAREPDDSALLTRIFNEADKDGQGTLDVEEIAGLLRKAAVAKIIGDRSPEDLLRAMDTNRDHRVCFNEFKEAMLGVKQEGAQPYKKGETVLFWSSICKTWIPALVIDAESDAIQVDCKPSFWIRGGDLRDVKPHPSGNVSPSKKSGLARQFLSVAFNV